MDQHRWFVTAVAAAVLGGYSDTASGEQMPPPVIMVLAYNYAGISADVLSAARNKVSAVYEKVGVEIIWSEPPPAKVSAGGAQGECPHPFAIQVMIRARQAEWEPGRKRIMGLALAPDEGRAVLSLFYDAMMDVALRYRSPLDDILAIALAHEMGHALLPPPAHEITGIMHARWEGDDIRHAIVGSLTFTEAQGDTIRAKAERRCAATARHR